MASAAPGYDVFLSFRGPDKRQGSVDVLDVLYHALTDAGIRVFRDADGFEAGDTVRVIPRCRILVPIFSRSYVSRSWCLRELTMMVESVKGSSREKIIPVICGVGVDDAKLKTGLYSEDLKKRLKKYGRDQVEQWWRRALRDLAEINGRELKDTGHAQFARSFVSEISWVLKLKHLRLTKYFVPMDDQVEALMKLLDTESSEVRFVGISGIGGSGKTTLAKVVYNKLCDHFDSCSFLADVRKSSRKHKGTEQLQEKLLHDLGVGWEEIMDVDEGIARMTERLVQKKVLIVLDDVDHKNQMENLAGDATWFGCGSRIIVTTRDQGVLDAERLRNKTLEVEAMRPEEARRLLCRHAFGEDTPPSDYLGLLEDVLASAGRLPLALEVIGSSLRGKPCKVWADTIQRLKEVPHQNVREKPMISEALDGEMADAANNLPGKTNVDPRKRRFEDLEGSPAADVVIQSAGKTHTDYSNTPALDSITGVESGRTLGTPCEVVLSFIHNKIGSLIFEDMKEAGISVFGVNEELHEGEKTDEKSLRAIINSEICIPIFTKHYACSARCLRELVHMVDARRKLPRRHVIPIFYDVGPSDVKLETEIYIDALDEHRVNFPPETVREWEEALKEVAQLQGWNFKAEGSKNNIKCVVKAVLNKLKERQRRVLVGIEAQVEKLKELLQDESQDALFVGIHGIGGIGKTTLAKSIFDQISTHFEATSFLRDVRERSKHKGLKYLQDQLLRDITGADIESKTQTTRQFFLEKKVLIVLDDVNETRQIEKLVGRSNQFVSGSRILVTTRDVNVLSFEPETLDEDISKGPREFRMEKMELNEALELFWSHAFGEGPPLDNYLSTCEEVVKALGGLPLALEIMGSFLNGKPKNVWNATLEKLQNLPDQELQAILMIVYDEALDRKTKEVFLDIACFFNGVEKTTPIYMWDACELLPKQGIEVLIVMSFIKVLDDKRLWMHDEVRDFGRKIAHGRATVDLESGSRFWSNQKVLDILRSKKVNKNVQGLRLRFDQFLKDCNLEELTNLPELRFLDFSGFPIAVKFDLPNLRWLSWHCCPRDVRGTVRSCLENLVILDLSKSDITDQFCGSDLLQSAKNLKVLNLTGCKRMTRTPVFSEDMILERLILEDCKKLVKIDSSIGKLKKLLYLNLKECYSLEELPKELGSAKSLTELVMKGNGQSFKLQGSTIGLTSLTVLKIYNVEIVDALNIGTAKRLEQLTLSKCSGVIKFLRSAQFFMSLVKLDVSGSDINQLPDTFGEMRKLKVVNMESTLICKLPKSIGKLLELEELNIRKCRGLRGEIPSEIGNLSSLSILDLSFTGISSLPSTLSRLSNLQTLNLESCYNLKGLPELPKSLVSLHVTSEELQHLPDLSEISGLSDLQLSCTMNEFQADWVEKLARLEKLELCIPRLTALKFGITSQLRSLSVSCRNAETLPNLPSTLSRLRLSHLKRSTKFTSLCHLERLTFLEFIGCSIGDVELRSLEIVKSKSLEHFSASKCNFSTVSGPWLPARLRLLSLYACKLHNGLLDVSGLEDLILLKLVHCQKLSVLRGLGGLESLEEIVIWNCNSLGTLGDLSKLQKLESLRVEHCQRFREVEGLERIESLNHINVLRGSEQGPFPSTTLAIIAVITTMLPTLMDLYGWEWDRISLILDRWSHKRVFWEMFSRFFK